MEGGLIFQGDLYSFHTTTHQHHGHDESSSHINSPPSLSCLSCLHLSYPSCFSSHHPRRLYALSSSFFLLKNDQMGTMVFRIIPDSTTFACWCQWNRKGTWWLLHLAPRSWSYVLLLVSCPDHTLSYRLSNIKGSANIEVVKIHLVL